MSSTYKLACLVYEGLIQKRDQAAEYLLVNAGHSKKSLSTSSSMTSMILAK